MRTYYHHNGKIFISLILKALFSNNNYDEKVTLNNLLANGEFSVDKSDSTALFGSARMAFYSIMYLLRKMMPNRSKVILSPYTCSSVVNAVKYVGLEPVFIDCDKNGCGLDEGAIIKRISYEVICVISVNVYGFKYNTERLYEIASKHGSILIEDCAHSFLPVLYSGNELSNVHFQIYSFGPTKPISGRHGGIVFCKEKFSGLIRQLDSIYKNPEIGWGKRVIFSYLAGIIEDRLIK